MKTHQLYIVLHAFAVLVACSETNPSKPKSKSGETPPENTPTIEIQKTSKYTNILSKFKPISFDTLKVVYTFEDKNNRFLGQELSLKEAQFLPIGVTENYFGKLSGVYACYQFVIDSNTIGLIARIPSEYESSTIKLFLFDIQKDKVVEESFYLAENLGDAGEFFQRISWLYKTNEREINAFVYDYSSSQEIDDTTNTIDESREYVLINCMNEKFDTISKNEAQLKKKFKKQLK